MESDSGITREEVYHDAARHFLDVQISTHNLLDNKSAQIFSVGSVVLPVTFALLNLGLTRAPLAAEWALASALVFYIILLVCASQASRIRALEYRPYIPTLKEHSQNYPSTALKRWVADEYERSSQENAKVLETKAFWVGIANHALYLETLSLSVAAIFTLLL